MKNVHLIAWERHELILRFELVPTDDANVFVAYSHAFLERGRFQSAEDSLCGFSTILGLQIDISRLSRKSRRKSF